jgi:hypothetical protein
VCVCVSVTSICSPLIVIMCDICVKQTYQSDSHSHIVKNITSDRLVVVLLAAECNHDILLALSVYAKIRSAVDR